MSKKTTKFQFKQFAVSHHRSSMKVGVDAVIIGCWAETVDAKRILDVGTGCGVIALIMAQRALEAHIEAIDIDAPSIEEAKENFENSPWQNRLNARICSYSDAATLLKVEGKGFDLIVSNPPYFDSGVTELLSAREKARHQGELSPQSLLEGAKKLLDQEGRIAMIVPTEILSNLEALADVYGYNLERKCFVRGHEKAPYKRVLMQWRNNGNIGIEKEIETQFLTIEEAPGLPTEGYHTLCREFYLRF